MYRKLIAQVFTMQVCPLQKIPIKCNLQVSNLQKLRWSSVTCRYVIYRKLAAKVLSARYIIYGHLRCSGVTCRHVIYRNHTAQVLPAGM